MLCRAPNLLLLGAMDKLIQPVVYEGELGQGDFEIKYFKCNVNCNEL